MMRNLALFLLAVNLLVAAWFYLLHQEAAVSRQPPPLAVGADLVLRSELPDYAREERASGAENSADVTAVIGDERLPDAPLSADESIAEPAAELAPEESLAEAGDQPTTAESCLVIGPFDSTEQAQNFGLDRQIESARIVTVPRSRVSNWQVIVAGDGSPIEELRARLGFSGFDSFPVEVDGRPALRIGVFGIESNADGLVNQLSGEGFDARKLANRVGYSEYWLQLEGIVGELLPGDPEPGSRLQQKTCAEVASPDNIQ